VPRKLCSPRLSPVTTMTERAAELEGLPPLPPS
jgi:hypothetical protein